MFDQHPHISKEELGKLFPSGWLPTPAMLVLATEAFTKEQVHQKLKEIADNCERKQ